MYSFELRFRCSLQVIQKAKGKSCHIPISPNRLSCGKAAVCSMAVALFITRLSDSGLWSVSSIDGFGVLVECSLVMAGEFTLLKAVRVICGSTPILAGKPRFHIYNIFFFVCVWLFPKQW